MDIILLERIGRLGQMGDTVRVRDGYARNYLLPQGKALRATDENRARFERDREGLEVRNRERQGEAEAAAAALEGQFYVVVRQAGATGQLYGSVSTRDIADLVTAGGGAVVRSQVDLKAPIKTIGLHPVTLRLHAEVAATVTINVARSADEAERQARGEVLTQRDEAFALEPDTEDEDGEDSVEGEAVETVAADESEEDRPAE